MADQEPSKIDERYDKGRGSYLLDKETGVDDSYASAGVDQTEAYANDPGNSSVRNREYSPSTNHETDMSRGESSGKKSPLTLKNVIKKRGPIGIVLLLLGLGGIGLGGLFGGAGLIINLKEMLSANIMDAVPTINEIRARSMLKQKLQNDALGGVCSPVTIRCKYKTMSDRQIQKLTNAGIKVNVDGSNVFGTRSKVTSLEFNGKTITASNLINEMRSDSKLASALNRAYSSRLATWSSSAFYKLANRVSITKQKVVSGSDKTAFKEQLRTGMSSTAATARTLGLIEVDENGQKVYYEQNPDGSRGAQVDSAKAQELLNSDEDFKRAEEQRKNAVKAADGNQAWKAGLKASLLVGVGVIDASCTGWNIVRTAGYAAKYLGALQLIRYANVFLTTADAMKAGDATAEEVEFLANILTSQNSQGLSATDSRGYKYAAYGDISGIPETGTSVTNVTPSDEQLDQELLKTEVTNYVNGQITSDSVMAQLADGIGQGGASTSAIDASCGFVKSGWGQAIIITTGVAFLTSCVVTTIVTVGAGAGCMSASAIAGTAAGVAIAITINLLSPLLISMATDTLITGDENGNQAGNAIVSGSGALNFQVGLASGGGMLSKSQAITFKQLSDDTNQYFAAIDRNDYAATDVMNGNTFFGQIRTMVAPYLSKASLFGGISLSSSLLSSSARTSFSPTSYAASYGDAGVCNDPDLDEYATDAFCNPIVGQSTQTLNLTEDEVLDYLINNGHIDEITGKALSDDYKNFIKYCTERVGAIGAFESGEDMDVQGGKICSESYGKDTTSATASPVTKWQYFRAFTTMEAVENVMSGENIPESAQGSTDEEEPTGEPEESGTEGWKNPTDSPSTACGFDCYGGHTGMDVTVSSGTNGANIYATRDGVVTLAGYDGFTAAMCQQYVGFAPYNGPQQSVEIEHTVNGQTWKTRYTHVIASSITVRVGDRVTAGELVAKAGSTGCSTGPHLHMRVTNGAGTRIDPTAIFGRRW